MKRVLFIVLAAILACGTGYAQKTYKVGDYYTFENGKEGIVFEVTDDGLHGKVVSVACLGTSRWAEKGYDKVSIGATSRTDGAYNMEKIKEQDTADVDWYRKYGAAGAAYVWMGEGWYLPSIEELQKIILDESVHRAIDFALTTHFRASLQVGGYWSSTEVEGAPNQVWTIYSGGVYIDRAGQFYIKGKMYKKKKSYGLDCKVLPVRAF